MKTVRASSIKGIFYPGDPVILQDELDSYLSRSQPILGYLPKFLIVPHAGYVYSGKVAGEGYSNIPPDSYSHVVILGPSHRHYFSGIVQSGVDAWETPLGEVPVRSLDHFQIISKPDFHSNEHCLEIQLPFIQHRLPKAEVSPLLLSGPLSTAEKLADVLIEFDTESTLWVVSSDFSHVGPNFQYYPEERGFKNGEAIDRKAIEYIEDSDISGFERFIQQNDATICGALPILVSMWLVRKITHAKFILKQYDCSGNQTQDINSVGYAALYC